MADSADQDLDHMVTADTTKAYSSRVPRVLLRLKAGGNKRKVTVREDKRSFSTDLDEATRARFVGETMRYILFSGTNLEKISTKKIKSSVQGVNDLNIWQFIELMSVVQARFKHAFGYDLVSSAAVSGSGATNKSNPKPGYGGTNESWFLVNGMDTSTINREAHAKDDRVAERGFLMAVLGILMIEGPVVNEDKLWELLNQLDIDIDGSDIVRKRKRVRNDEISRDPSKVINELVRKMYLSKKKVKNERNKNGTTMLEYTYGARTLDEIGRENILRFVMQTTNTPLPKSDIFNMVGVDPTEVVESAED